jgi:hypothetical protein
MPLDHYVFVRVEHVHINDGAATMNAALSRCQPPGARATRAPGYRATPCVKASGPARRRMTVALTARVRWHVHRASLLLLK